MKEQCLFGHAILVAKEKSQRDEQDRQWLLKYLLTYCCQRQVTQPSSSSGSTGQVCIPGGLHPSTGGLQVPPQKQGCIILLQERGVNSGDNNTIYQKKPVLCKMLSL